MYLNFFLNLLILFLTLINVFKCRLLNIKKANYFIIKNNKDLIDPRSIKFTNLNKKKLSNSINFVRSPSYILSLKALFKLKNIIILSSVHGFIFKKNKKLKKKTNLSNKEYISAITSIVKFLKINQFKMIDDYRVMPLFLPILDKLNITSIGFMHGRISSKLKYQKNLKLYKFDKYYVWNKYFKKKILDINRKYVDNEIYIKNPLKKYLLRKINQTQGLFLISEDNVSNDTYLKIINKLKKQKKFKIYFKFRPNNILDQNLIKILKKNNIQYFHKENIYKLFLKHNIKLLFAFNSSLLIESSFYNIIPVMIFNKNLNIKEYLEDNLVFGCKINQLSNIFNYLGKMDEKLKIIKINNWGN
tara:strand:- start:1320 stop:2396 length:1077 start_codon:yes stop_codon:yes gene_type:complete